MKLWRSPVFYLGVLLVLAVAGALVAPYVIDWARYRPTLERYATELTGRRVEIAGPISVNLFPWPRLSLENVHVSNAPGADVRQMMSADRVDIRVALAALINGTIQVEAVEVARPVISLERMASGEGNWHFSPSHALRRERLLGRVKLDQIGINGGTVEVIDSRRGWRASIDDVQLSLAAADLAGPWRIRGTGNYKGRVLDLAINTGSYREQEPLKFGIRVGPLDRPGLTYSFDGQNDSGQISGALKIEAGSSAPGGKADAEGELRPVEFRAQLVSDFDRIQLSKIEIAPRGAEPGSNVLAGAAEIRLGQMISLDAHLSGSKFDIDTVIGAKSRTLLRQGRGLELLQTLVEGMPDTLEARADIAVRSLVAGGSTLENAKLDVGLLDGALRIHELSANLPGQSRSLFDGVFIVTGDGPQLAGDLAGESANLRELAKFLWPEARDAIAQAWTGSSGRLKLQTRLDFSSRGYRASDASMQINDAIYKGAMTLTPGAGWKADLRVDADLVDFDSFMPNGLFAPVAIGGFQGVAGWTDATGGRVTPELRLALSAGRLRLNGIEARNVVLDIASDAGGVDLRQIEIGKVGDAKLAISGSIQRSVEQAAHGRISAKVTASDPHGLVRLLGLAPGKIDPPWLKALGETDLTITALLKPDTAGPQATLDLDGRSGSYQLSGSASLALNGADRAFAGTLELRTGTSSALARLVQSSPPTVKEDTPGRVTLRANGSVGGAIEIDAQAQAFGASASYLGTLDFSQSPLALSGRIALNSDRPEPLIRAMGLAWQPAGLLSAEAEIATTRDGIKLDQLRGFAGGEAFSGRIALENGTRLNGEIDGGSIWISNLLGAALLPWDGTQTSSETAFAAALPLRLDGELWLRPRLLHVMPGLDVSESQIGLKAEGETREIALFGKVQNGDSVSFEMTSKPDGETRAIEGKLTVPADLSQLLRTTDGEVVASGELHVDASFRGSGRSPASVLADLSGSGSYTLKSVSLARINPAAFSAAARVAKTAADVRGALTALVSNGALKVTDSQGTIAAIGGVIGIGPVTAENPDVTVTVKPRADVAAGTMDISTVVQLKAIPDLPAMQIIYAGSPYRMVRVVDSAALESSLGLKVLRQGMSELERLQQEQLRALEEEERARKEDEAKYQAYLDQRRELQMRVRELQAQRTIREAEKKRAREEARKARQKKPAPPETASAEPPKKNASSGSGPVVLVPPQGGVVLVPPAPQKERSLLDDLGLSDLFKRQKER